MERRICLVEVDDVEWIRVGCRSAGPFRDENGCLSFAVDAPQISEVDIEVLDQTGEDALGGCRCGGVIDVCELEGNSGDQSFERC
ncbi:hypothetical protein [Nocardia brevicatena]|uniref:hypothetical protein n=1 Tax=Nocardia brevicatena TaxID=37327 RepID=UPI001FDFE554|nr:hypothetical protein [Nocardia brevicatena]